MYEEFGLLCLSFVYILSQFILEHQFHPCRDGLRSEIKNLNLFCVVWVTIYSSKAVYLASTTKGVNFNVFFVEAIIIYVLTYNHKLTES